MIKLLVDVKKQTGTLFVDGVEKKKYKLSTAKNGVGSVPESGCTPLGKLRVSEKFGDAAEIGSVFKDRLFTGEVVDLKEGGGNLVLTRILWLEGTEPENATTKDRYIYLHGTRNEDKLGTPNSAGCITFSNKDIVEIYDLMPVGSEVEVVA